MRARRAEKGERKNMKGGKRRVESEGVWTGQWRKRQNAEGSRKQGS